MKVLPLLRAAKRFASGAPPEVDDKLRELTSALPTPVVWLLGKTQAGKSSLVRTLTGREDLLIGEGFRSCTSSSSLYAFPSDEAPLLYFLDTKGLFESGYDENEDISVLEGQAHVLTIVVKAGDAAIEDLVKIVKRISSRHKEWPVLVIQTCLHECYPGALPHPDPYPFHDLEQLHGSPYQAAAECLKLQQKHFSGLRARFVPVDLTQQEDPYSPHNYGAEALLAAFSDVLPQTAWNLISQTDSRPFASSYLKSAQAQIMFYSGLSAAAALSPLPFLDVPLLAVVQLKMLHSISRHYQQTLTYERIAEVLGMLGWNYAWRFAWRELLKVVPGASAAYSAYVGASTYALGNVFCAYFEIIHSGSKPSADKLRRIYCERLERATKDQEKPSVSCINSTSSENEPKVN